MNKNVKITNNIEDIIEYQTKGLPCILILDDSNKNKDTSKAKYCALLSREDMLGREYNPDDSILDGEIRIILGDDYLNLVEARCYGKPLVIAMTERLLIRELMIKDVDKICDIYEGEETGFIQRFYESKEDAAGVMDRYIHEVYDFYGYGLWAVVLKESQEVIGIVGFTPRDSKKDVPDIELGYAINKQYRNKGYGYEAAKAAIEYAEKNIEYGQILICVNKNNIPGKNLGNKIKVLTSDVFFCSID